MKKIFAIVLALLLIVTTLPLAFAEKVEGTLGKNLTWSYDTETKTLAIDGEGDMSDFRITSNPPWEKYEDEIKNVVIGNGVTSIGKFVFYSSKLENLALGNAVKKIGESAFKQCRKLKEINFPEGLETIGEEAFNGCTSLEKVEITANVKVIGDKAFSSCNSVKEFAVAYNNANYTAVDGVLYNKAKTELVRYPNGKTESIFKIPDDVKIIGVESFAGSGLKRVVIPETVTTIDEGAFYSCTKLDYIAIPEGVIYVNNGAFRDCKGLSTLYFPSQLRKVNAYAFAGCNNLMVVNYEGNETQWDNVDIDLFNDSLKSAAIKFNASTHNHSYKTEILKIVTCTENGTILYKCSCGDALTEELVAEGHNFGEWRTTVEPTTTTEGEKVRFCKKCLKTEKEKIDKLPQAPDYTGSPLGDVNGDKKVTAIDARVTLQYVSGSRDFSIEQATNADVNRDGKVTSIDARWILQVAAGTRVLENNAGGNDTPTPDDTTKPDEDVTKPEDDVPAAATKADVIKIFNDATAKAAKGSYKIARQGEFVEPVDMGSSTDTLNSIIQSTDENANLDTVVGGFLGINEPINATVTNGKCEGVNSKYMLKAMTLKDTDVKSFKVEGSKYTIQLVDCVNPADGSALSHATNDFITVAEVNKTIEEAAGSSITVTEKGSNFNYCNITFTATVVDGKITNLEYAYTLDATLNLKISVVNATGTGKIAIVGKYTDIKY